MCRPNDWRRSVIFAVEDIVTSFEPEVLGLLRVKSNFVTVGTAKAGDMERTIRRSYDFVNKANGRPIAIGDCGYFCGGAWSSIGVSYNARNATIQFQLLPERGEQKDRYESSRCCDLHRLYETARVAEVRRAPDRRNTSPHIHEFRTHSIPIRQAKQRYGTKPVLNAARAKLFPPGKRTYPSSASRLPIYERIVQRQAGYCILAGFLAVFCRSHARGSTANATLQNPSPHKVQLNSDRSSGDNPQLKLIRTTRHRRQEIEPMKSVSQWSRIRRTNPSKPRRTNHHAGKQKNG